MRMASRIPRKFTGRRPSCRISAKFEMKSAAENANRKGAVRMM